MKLTKIGNPAENYSDVIRSLRVCAGEDPKNEGCEGCIYETGSCYNATTLMSRAACVIEDLCELYAKAMEEKTVEPVCKVSKPKILQLDDLQTEEGLGEASPKETETEAEAAIRKLIDDLLAESVWLEGRPVLEDIPANMWKAARLLEINLHCRNLHSCIESANEALVLDALREIK